MNMKTCECADTPRDNRTNPILLPGVLLQLGNNIGFAGSMPSLYALVYLLVSTHFYTWLSWKRLNIHTHKVSHQCVLPLVSLRSEEIILPLKGYFCWRLSWNRLYTHAYQVSPPCVLYILSKFKE